MSKSDLTPEEPESIRKSKDPSVSPTSNGAAEKATVYVYDLDTFVEVQLLSQPRYSRWTHCERKTVICVNGIQVSYHIHQKL